MSDDDIWRREKDKVWEISKVINVLLLMIDEGHQIQMDENVACTKGAIMKYITDNWPSVMEREFFENIEDPFDLVDISESRAKKRGFRGITLEYLILLLNEKATDISSTIWQNQE
jgi:hypothetical protein